MEKINMLLVDDHLQTLEGLCYRMSGLPIIEEIVYTTEPEKALAFLNQKRIDIVLLDIYWGQDQNPTGLDLAKKMVKTKKDIKIIFNTLTDKFVNEAKALGAYAYVNKAKDIDYLIKNIEFVAKGEKGTWPDVKSPLISVSILTKREKVIAKELVETSLEPEEIAIKLNIVLSTLNTHIQKIYRKIGVKKRHALTLFAKEHEIY